MPNNSNHHSIPFDHFLDTIKRTLQSVFYEKDQIEKFTQRRGFPALVLRDIMACNPLSVAIPEAYGGRGGKVKECLGLLETAAYESLPLSLTFGINLALFLEPVAKYGQEPVKKEVFDRFLTKQNMGGLMITEPDFGSDALNMQTWNVKTGSDFQIEGIKHWQGLTGMADYWLIASRNKQEDQKLGRDLDFFVCDISKPDQFIEVEEYYNNLGLYPIPYGRNKIRVRIPEMYKLQPETTGLKLMMDLLHRSRYQFPGMGIGFIRRMLDEAISHCQSRLVGGKPLWSLDQVQHQISRIQSAYTISSAMCVRSTACSGIAHNVAGSAVEANSFKAYITDLMQESAQIVTQLLGANGYKAESIGARGIIDSRPFQIFEGSNEMLYTQITETVLKSMAKLKTLNLIDYLQQFELTSGIAGYFKTLLNFTPGLNLTQRKIVDLGKIISRVIAANLVAELGDKGFSKDLTGDTLKIIRHEIAVLVSSYQSHTTVKPAENYHEWGNWMVLC